VGLDQPATPTVYVPQSQVPDGLTSMMNRAFSFSWIVRTESAPGLGDAVRRAVRTVDPELPVARILPMEKVVGESVARRRFNALLMGAFSVLALILAVVGLYGVLSYQVAQRTREIGIRMALGAGRGRVLRQIVGQGMRLVGMGMLLGLVSAFWLTRLLSGLLFEIQPRDPGSFAGVSLLLAGTAVLACYLPARRATRVDPAVALRYE